MSTDILSAKQVFSYSLYGVLRRLGLRAEISRRRVWIVGEDEARFFDLARDKDLERFNAYKAALIARAERKRKAKP